MTGANVAACDLDPEIAIFVEQMTRAWAAHPPFTSVPLPEARAIAERVRAPWTQGGPVMAAVTERDVPTGSGPVRVRIYDPGVTEPAGMLIYIHGGGWTLFSIDTHDRLMREYAAAGGFLVVGVDYPLSPEARYPVALDGIVDVIDWLLDGNAETFGGDPARMAIGGDSVGGNLSLATALRLRDRGSPGVLSGTLLNYGAFTRDCSDAAEARYGGPDAVLNQAEMAVYFANYVGADEALASDPYVCPLVADCAGLPPALLVIPECDVLTEQSHAMAERLAAAGVAVEARVYAGATHSFLEAMSVAAVARQAIADGAAWVKARLAVVAMSGAEQG
jgi:acetyl esterase